MQRRRLERRIHVSPLNGLLSYGGGEYWGEQSHDVDYIVSMALILVSTSLIPQRCITPEPARNLGKAPKGKKQGDYMLRQPIQRICQYIERHCEASLRRLGTDYIDVIYTLAWTPYQSSIFK